MAATTKVRIVLTGVGGQGTLTATTLLAQAGLDAGLPVTSGEIHGMAQRGGVVESTVLFGGYLSPRIGPGEADVLLGFEPLETLRALPCLAPGASVVSNSEPIAPIGVSIGRETYPDVEAIKSAVTAACGAERALFLPCKSLAGQAGNVMAANMVLLGAACALGVFPFDLERLNETIRTRLPARIVDVNLRAVALGAEAAGR